jgi:hypothetical protein
MTLPDYAPFFYPVAAFAILLTGISKGGFGQGGGGIAVPLMAMFIAPPEAAGIMLPILCAMDIVSLHAYWRAWSREDLARLVPGALAGIAAGSLAFGLLPVNAIRLLLGIISVAFALNAWLRVTERLAGRLGGGERRPGRAAGAIAGVLSGFTSTLAHAGGPPFVVYMLAQKVDKRTFVGTSVLYFALVNYVKLVPYYLLGQLNVGNLTTALLFAPLVPLGVWLGVLIHRRISPRAFFNTTYGLLFVTGVKLIDDALRS